jgi:hypothetical protein
MRRMLLPLGSGSGRGEQERQAAARTLANRQSRAVWVVVGRGMSRAFRIELRREGF